MRKVYNGDHDRASERSITRMDDIIKAGWLLLFMASGFGYWEYFRRKAGMNVFFLPAFTISLQSLILFFGGILNILKPSAIVLFGAGLLMAAYYLLKDFKNAVIPYLNIGYLFLGVGLLAVLIATKGQVFWHYDNFSHWAMVVRNMLATNRYPSFADRLILFQEYPLGSASYIYYFAKVVSESECMQMTAQAFMMLCFILPVFKYVKKHQVISGVFVTVFTNFLFCYNITIVNLLVDTLLPLQGMAALFFVYSECCGFDRADKKGDVSVLYAIPFLCTAVQIKNSGIFFAAMAFGLILFSLKYERTDLWKKIAAIVSPLLTIYLWQAHCGYVFDNASVSKHAMTVENYSNTFSSKSDGIIQSIFTQLLNVSVTDKNLYYILAFLAVTGVVCFCVLPDLKKQYLKMAAASAGIYVLYMAGVFFMYLFSMPEPEAVRLAGITRYMKTVYIAVYYLIILMSLVMLSHAGSVKKRWICTAVVFVLLIANWRGPEGRFSTIFETSPAAERLWVELAIRDYHVENGSSYIICIPKSDAGYAYYLCKYLLYSPDISSRVVTDASQLEDTEGYRYMFVYDSENALIGEWEKANYPDQAGNDVIILGDA